MKVRTRIAAVGAFAVPLALAATGVASATEDHCGGGYAEQGGGLVGLDAGIDPALNIGSILGGGPSVQSIQQLDASNSGIVQSGGGCTIDGGALASQVAPLVGVDLDVSPAINLGGILSGASQQSIAQVDRSNSGILQG